MKTVLLIALITIAFTARVQQKNFAKITTDLKKSTYGNALLHLVELHSMAGGPVQELIDAIEELINDLEEELEELEFNFQQRTNQHNSLVIGFEQDIQDAVIDVNNTQDTLDNLLFPRKEQLEVRIEQIQEYQEANRKKYEEAVLTREQEHEDFEFQVAELNDATAAVDDALALLSSLTNPSLLQIKRFQNSLKNIESKIKSRSKMAPMIKALITLASNQNFSDQGIISQIVNALNEFRNAIVDSINAQTAAEADAQAEHEEYLSQLDTEFAEFQRQINRLNVDLTATNEKIDQLSEFRDQREADRKQYIAELELENNTYAEETDIYTNLKNEFTRELGVSEQALSVVESADFTNIQV
ncbi:unnamed protein product (macronuclear) [Paramecium tetraurelia]|uniref:Trichocyst matrix protein n=1 Tax=Paramecium tetraurelia TaxID=5888 RepID=A0D2C5_PARTE|nr:uncharacterized protein GSPATT00012698001 [Paramecium tetraurelia]CAK77192.1 unnamed protein product [Paramecium tetraurelia]|eukprot:XP_001444589.1 hypothetical protein (macronuclear) [Paramecium tetraurelia strain d4-2]